MENPLAYKLAIDLGKHIIKYQNNVDKGMRYNEYQTVERFAFSVVDCISEDNINEALKLLHRVKMRLQILTEMNYIAINQATLMCTTAERVRTELLSQGKAAVKENHNDKGVTLASCDIQTAMV